MSRPRVPYAAKSSTPAWSSGTGTVDPVRSTAHEVGAVAGAARIPLDSRSGARGPGARPGGERATTTAMRILMLTTEYYGIGGVQTYGQLCCHALCSASVEVDVLAVRASGPPMLPCPGRYLGDDGHRSTLWMKLRFAAAALGANGRYDLVICAHVAVAPLGLVIRLLRGIPYVVVGHGVDVWGRLGLARRTALRVATRVLAVSQFTANMLALQQRVPRARLRVLYPAAPPALANELRVHRRDETLTLLTVARLAAQARHKCCDTVIRALPLLIAAGIRIRYVIVGDGSDRPRLTALARALGVGSFVTFRGRVTPSELAREYRRCDVYVMPSVTECRGGQWRGEGLGLTYLEAAAFGCVVVAGSGGGAPETVHDGVTGVLVDGRDVGALTGMLLRLARDPALRERMGHAGVEWVRTRFGFRRFRQGLLDVAWAVRARGFESSPSTADAEHMPAVSTPQGSAGEWPR